MVNDLEEGLAGRHMTAAADKVAVAGMGAVLGRDTAGRSLAGDIRSS